MGPQATALCSTSYSNAPGCCPRRSRRRPYLRVACTEEWREQAEALRPVVKSVPTTRTAARPPTLAPIEHSSAYLVEKRRQQAGGPAASSNVPARRREDFSGGAVEWVLKKADESLDEIEQNPPEYAKKLYEISTGPIGTAAAKGATTAAKVTVAVGAQAIKVALPVGKWALKQGISMAASAVTQGLLADQKKGSKKERRGKDEKSNGA